MEELVRFETNLPIDDLSSCIQIAKELSVSVKADWIRKEISSEIFTNGITNKIFSLYLPNNPRDRLVFRVFGENTDRIIDRPHELVQWRKLAGYGLAAPLYATFQNGIICGYLPGSPITKEMLRDSKISRKIAQATAKMHEIKTDDPPCTWEKIEKFIDNIDTEYEYKDVHNRFELVFSEISLRQLSQELRRKIIPFKPSVVFCHNDLLIHNIVYDEEKQEIGFIDYEYADANYELFDIANHFNEWAGVEKPDYSHCPTTEEKKKWIKHYYSFREREEASEEKIEEVMCILPLFEGASHLFWAAWALVQSQNSTINFDYLGYAIERFTQYEIKMEEYNE